MEAQDDGPIHLYTLSWITKLITSDRLWQKLANVLLEDIGGTVIYKFKTPQLITLRKQIGNAFATHPLSYFPFQPVLHDWCNKGRGMCYPVCGMVHIKEPLLLIRKSSLCGGSG